MAHHVTGGHGQSIIVFDAPSSIYRYTLEKFREISSAAAAERGLFTVALSGGRTPVGFYREASAAEGIDWSRTHIFQVDERFVPPSDSRSNFGMIGNTLIDPAAVPRENVHPIPVGGADADACAIEYAGELRAFFTDRAGLAAEEMPGFDLVMLGMGEDGHTASLFPASGVLEEKKQPVRAVPAEGGRIARITLTLPVINNARNVFFLVTGEGKAEALRRVAEEGDASLPASRVRPHAGSLAFLCDKAAASQLAAFEGPL